MKVNVYNTKGAAAKPTEISDVVFAAAANNNLVHQVVTAMRANARQDGASTKDRSEVSGGGRKPWKQKGTGNARHGSRRSPIWKGGGVTFGPARDRDFSQKVNKKMKTSSLYSALSAKHAAGRILFVDGLTTELSTKGAHEIFLSLQKAEGFETLTHPNPSNVCVILADAGEVQIKSIRNLAYGNVTDALNLNTFDVTRYRYLVIVDPSRSSQILESRHHSNETIRPSKVVTSDTAKA